MIKPFLDQNSARCQPNGMNTWNAQISRAVGVTVAMTMTNVLKDVVGAFGVEVAIQADGALPSHVEAANQQHARNTQRAQAFHLAEAQGESIRGRLQAPRDGGQGENVGGEVGYAVPSICCHCLGIECPSTNKFGNCHAQVGNQADSRNSHAGIILVCRCEICAVVVVVMSVATMAVTMAVITVIAGLL